jgi:hypothetical protein
LSERTSSGIVAELMEELPDEPVYRDARQVFERVALREVFVEFLTLTAYAQLLGHPVHEAGARRCLTGRRPTTSRSRSRRRSSRGDPAGSTLRQEHPLGAVPGQPHSRA